MKPRSTTWLLSSLLTLFLLLMGITAAPASAHDESSGTIEVDLEITDATVDPRTGTVTVTGTVRCSEEGMASVGVEVMQRVGRIHTVGGRGHTDVQCGPQSTSFTVVLEETFGVLKPGEARIRAFANIWMCDEETWECQFGHDDVDITMRLHRSR